MTGEWGGRQAAPAARQGRGYFVSFAGAMVGALLLGVPVAALIAGPSSDATNGWFHDPDGWLVLLVPLAASVGMPVGTALALRLTGHADGLRTGILTAAGLLAAVGLAAVARQATAFLLIWFASPVFARWLTVRATAGAARPPTA